MAEQASAKIKKVKNSQSENSLLLELFWTATGIGISSGAVFIQFMSDIAAGTTTTGRFVFFARYAFQHTVNSIRQRCHHYQYYNNILYHFFINKRVKQTNYQFDK